MSARDSRPIVPDGGDESSERAIRRDSLFAGQLICRQYREGYRFSIDAVLLAHFPKIGANEKILDLGAGCGILGLILCHRHRHRKITVTGLEVQPDLVRLARDNVGANGFEQWSAIIEGDAADCKGLCAPESFSLVLANPPFHPRGSGRLSRNREALAARHQDTPGLDTFVAAASFCVKNRGRVAFIYPARRVAELVVCFDNHRLTAKRLQFIYSYPESATPVLALIEGVKNGGRGVDILPPHYLYTHRRGPYSAATQAMFQP